MNIDNFRELYEEFGSSFLSIYDTSHSKTHLRNEMDPLLLHLLTYDVVEMSVRRCIAGFRML